MLELGEAEPGRSFVVMELVEGQRLSEILSAAKPLDSSDAQSGALDLGAAVEALHNLGLVHGALRPQNVMVLADGTIKLMDVELAGLRDAPTPKGGLVVDPPAEYLAPEQITRASVTEKTDIYSFAVIVYELFCSVPPFQGPSREAVLSKHLNERPTPMHQRHAVSPEVERIVTRALDKDPERRPLMHEMLNVLWGADRPCSRRGEETMETNSRDRCRHRRRGVDHRVRRLGMAQAAALSRESNRAISAGAGQSASDLKVSRERFCHRDSC